eukprot:COSAG01_NODE_957_length_12474_cov_44.298182_17_plen_73_part_00
MACAHLFDLDECRPAGDVAGESPAQASVYTQDQFHIRMYVLGSNRAQGPHDIKRALEAAEARTCCIEQVLRG